MDGERAPDAAGPRTRAAAARSAHRTHRARGARCGLPARGAGHRERACRARSARASAGTAAGGGPGASQVPRRALRFPVAGRLVGILRRRAGAEDVAPPAGRRMPRAVRLVAAAARVARRSPAAGGDAGGGGLEVVAATAAGHRRPALRDAAQGGAGGAARQHRRPRRMPTSITWARAASSSTCIRGRDWRGRARAAAQQVDPGRGTHRDVAPVRALRREDRARLDRGGRGRSGHPRILRTALGREARRGRGRAARFAVRLDAGGEAHGFVRRDRSGGRARGLHPRGAGARRTGHARSAFSPTTGSWSRRSRNSSTRRGGRTCWSTTRPSRRSTRNTCRNMCIRWLPSSAGARRRRATTRGYFS